MIDDLIDIIAEVVWDIAVVGARKGAKSVRNASKNKTIKKAADIIQEGGLVAFPTETVYGLGADAFNSAAVERIYAAKGRPGDNPLILHVAKLEQFLQLADSLPQYALDLANAYWPGPLTLIIKKKYHLPGWLGGHPQNSTTTIGVRIPNHPTALALLQAANCPVAAPSANKSGSPSPTSVQHILDDFSKEDGIGLILDSGGVLDVGLESTVVDTIGELPVILRPGAITQEMIFKTTGLMPTGAEYNEKPRSPGMKYRHYAPKAPMVILKGTAANIATHILNICEAKPDKKIGAFVSDATWKLLRYKTQNICYIPLSNDHKTVAQNLFTNLRQFDKNNVSFIFAEAVDNSDLGTAIMDRMLKAAEGNVLDV